MTRPVAIVTGAGIGAAIAVRLAAQHDLILTHLTLDDDLRHIISRTEDAGAYPRIPWCDLDIATFRRQIEINLITHAACAKLVTPALTARRYGRIVAVSSVLTQLGRIDPAGSIEVPAEHAVVADHTAMVARQLDRQSIKRRGQPADIAAAVNFLTSRDAGFITGQCLTIDGGWCMT